MTLLTAQDIAEMWKVSPRQIRDRLAKRKDFPRPYRIGGVLRWHREECEKWLEKHRG